MTKSLSESRDVNVDEDVTSLWHSDSKGQMKNHRSSVDNMNPSNVPRVLSSSEAKKIEKSVAKEAAADEKHIAQVGKALKSAEKDEERAEKVCVSLAQSLFFKMC
jgi:hypothetical protein